MTSSVSFELLVYRYMTHSWVQLHPPQAICRGQALQQNSPLSPLHQLFISKILIWTCFCCSYLPCMWHVPHNNIHQFWLASNAAAFWHGGRVTLWQVSLQSWDRFDLTWGLMLWVLQMCFFFLNVCRLFSYILYGVHIPMCFGLRVIVISVSVYLQGNCRYTQILFCTHSSRVTLEMVVSFWNSFDHLFLNCSTI